MTRSTTLPEPIDSMTIRPARAEDAPAVRDVIQASYRQYEPLVPANIWAAYLADLLDVDVRAEHGVVLIAELNGRIMGSVTFYADGATTLGGWPADTAVVRRMAVDPVARGRGLGERLLEACIERGRRLGARSIGLHTTAMMAAAVCLYEGRGFSRRPDLDVGADDLLDEDATDAPRVIAYELVLDGWARP